MTIHFINNPVIWFIPWSNEVSSFTTSFFLFILPIKVSRPVFITMPLPWPLITLQPIKHILFISIGSVESLSALIDFSTAALSPVKDDWLINRSLLSNKYKSAGITLPALKVIMSPYTTFSCLISFCLLVLITSVKILICDFNFSLNL